MMYLFPWQSIAQIALIGAWEYESNETKGSWIITESHFSIAYYKIFTSEFLCTEGGSWSTKNGQMSFTWEYHTKNPELIETTKSYPVKFDGTTLSILESKWTRVDKGTPGELQGAWLITGRKRNGKIRGMTPGVRRTMKILSGTKFQWIAYNVETKEFFGTGGGRYTTENGRYNEHIEFFSRDNSRVGASLGFDYSLADRKWHHSGSSSKGAPIYEVWSTRQEIGF